MNAIDEREAATPESPNPSNGSAADPFHLAAERLRVEVDQTLSALKRAAYVERESLGLALFDVGLRGFLYATAGAAVLALAVAATLLVVSGARAGLQSWTGNAWWSDWILAIASLAVIAVAVRVTRGAVHRSTLNRTRRALAASRASELERSVAS